MHIKLLKEVNVNSPVMLAGWPGMGNVGVGAINYLREKLESTLFGEIESGPLWTPDSVVVEDGIAKIPVIPPSRFFYCADPPLIIFEGSFQPGGPIGSEVGREIIELASRLRVSVIYTGAAFATPISYRERSRVYGVANRKALRTRLREHAVEIMKEGQISGMNGLILGLAAQYNIDAMCLLATLPQYAINFPNPKASRAIVEVIEGMLDLHIDKKELDEAVDGMDQKLGLIEQKIKDTFYQMERDEDDEEVADDQVPSYVMEKIETLFGEVEKDRSKAPLLKSELDRWNLYELYEDRFLDLFRD